jgi:two-component system, LytTR family, sensor kinase
LELIEDTGASTLARRSRFLVGVLRRLSAMVTSRLSTVAGRRFVWTALVWFIAYVSFTVGAAIDQTKVPIEAAMRRVVVSLVGVLICWGMSVLIKRYSQSFSGKLMLSSVLSLPAAIAYGLVDTWVFLPLLNQDKYPMSVTSNIIWLTGAIYFVFLAWAAIYLMIGYEAEVQEKNLALAAAKNYALEAQNRMLRYQVNPHFLFNTLNAISTLVLDGKNETAELVILSLSRFLRHSLEKDLGDRIPLSEEMEVQRQYLAIEEIRFADRLRVEEWIPKSLLRARVPSLVLQPLVENCVKYAVAPSTRPVTIRIVAQAAEGRLRICVADDGTVTAPSCAPTLGIGLKNVKGRLETTYGAAAALEASRQPGGGFAVTLTLPLEWS